MSRLRGVLRLAGFAALTLPLMPVQQLLLWTSPRLARKFPHHYHKLAARMLGFRVELRGPSLPEGPCLLVANHVSWIDIVALSAVLPVSFISKREVGSWPFFGTLARLQRTVFIDRENRRSTAASRDELSARLQSDERLVLFAEGTSHDGSSILPFKSSYFAVGSAEAVSIIPVTLAYHSEWGLPLTRRRRPLFAWFGDMELVPHLWRVACAGPLGVIIAIHEPLPSSIKSNRKEAARVVEATVRDGLVRSLHGPQELR